MNESFHGCWQGKSLLKSFLRNFELCGFILWQLSVIERKLFSLWASEKFFLGPAMRISSSQRVEHVAFSLVGEFLGARVSVSLGDTAGDESTYAQRSAD